MEAGGPSVDVFDVSTKSARRVAKRALSCDRNTIVCS